ncbi:MAG: hypothetical protein ACJAVT_002286 [Yoonia sp.]|jgi:hypothetical protein
MEFLANGTLESIETTLGAVGRVRNRWEGLGYSWWAITLRETEIVIGAACLQNVANEPNAKLEIRWRLTSLAQTM